MVDAHIEQLERFEARINAVAVERFERARAEAYAADARIAGAEREATLPPLLGVPCVVNEVFNVAGLPHSAGLVARRHVRARSTAPAVERLLDAGAILLGLTNEAELSLWFETENRVYGRTANPYDLSRTAGGSSGGSGAVVGCGGAPIALGTDTGGSVRVPAFFCGVFGHKPSRGLVPQSLEFPAVSGETARMVTVGPFARRAEDLTPLLRALAEGEVGDPAEVSLNGLRVLLSERAFVARIRPELLKARERAAAALEARGARVERIALPEMRRMLGAALATLSDAGNATLSRTLKAGGSKPIRVRDALRPGGPHTVPLRLWALAEPLLRFVPRRRLRREVERGRAFAAELEAAIGDGVLLHPTLPSVAPRHGRTYGRLRFFQSVGVFNLSAVPVTQVPLGLGADGLPLGVQVGAGPGRDHVAIAAALELERAFGGWSAP